MPRVKHHHSITWSRDGIVGVCLCGGVFRRWRYPRERITGGILQLWYSPRFQDHRERGSGGGGSITSRRRLGGRS